MDAIGTVILFFSLLCILIYPLTLVVFGVYFQCKLEYQNKFFRKFDPNKKDGVV